MDIFGDILTSGRNSRNESADWIRGNAPALRGAFDRWLGWFFRFKDHVFHVNTPYAIDGDGKKVRPQAYLTNNWSNCVVHKGTTNFVRWVCDLSIVAVILMEPEWLFEETAKFIVYVIGG